MVTSCPGTFVPCRTRGAHVTLVQKKTPGLLQMNPRNCNPRHPPSEKWVSAVCRAIPERAKVGGKWCSCGTALSRHVTLHTLSRFLSLLAWWTPASVITRLAQLAESEEMRRTSTGEEDTIFLLSPYQCCRHSAQMTVSVKVAKNWGGQSEIGSLLYCVFLSARQTFCSDYFMSNWDQIITPGQYWNTFVRKGSVSID